MLGIEIVESMDQPRLRGHPEYGEKGIIAPLLLRLYKPFFL